LPLTLLLSLPGSGLLIRHANTIAVPAHWRTRLNWLGDLSYPLYLIHGPVLCTAITYYGITWPVSVVLCLIAAVAVLHLVDYPTRKLVKEYYGPGACPPVAVTAVVPLLGVPPVNV
jgi:peptidoglycan/LPS O-acetylase OafA/YrhL